MCTAYVCKRKSNTNRIRNDFRVEPGIREAVVGMAVPRLDHVMDTLQTPFQLLGRFNTNWIVQILHFEVAEGVGSLGAEEPRDDHRVQGHALRRKLEKDVALGVAGLDEGQTCEYVS